MLVKRENLSTSMEGSFRFFSWESSLDSLVEYTATGEARETVGMGNQWHYHPEVEIVLFLEGEGVRYVGDSVEAVKSPELVLLGENLPHHWMCEQSTGYCIQFSMQEGSPVRALPEAKNLERLLCKAAKGVIFSPRCAQEVKGLILAAIECGALERLSILLKILDRLSNARGRTISKVKPQALADSKAHAMQRAVQYIMAHAMDSELSLGDVLAHVSMSRATFSRHFQKVIGQSYTEFVLAIRLEKARGLLLTTDKAVVEVAFTSGFANLSHFNAQFKKKWGKTPRELRAANR